MTGLRDDYRGAVGSTLTNEKETEESGKKMAVSKYHAAAPSHLPLTDSPFSLAAIEAGGEHVNTVATREVTSDDLNSGSDGDSSYSDREAEEKEEPTHPFIPGYENMTKAERKKGDCPLLSHCSYPVPHPKPPYPLFTDTLTLITGTQVPYPPLHRQPRLFFHPSTLIKVSLPHPHSGTSTLSPNPHPGTSTLLTQNKKPSRNTTGCGG